MTGRSQRIVFFLFFLGVPFLMWVVPAGLVHRITFLGLGVLYVASRYWSAIRSFRNSLEIVFLYFVLLELSRVAGLESVFPLNVFLVICVLYFFLIRFRKLSRSQLFLKSDTLRGTLGVSIVFLILSIFSLLVWFVLQEGNPYSGAIPQVPVFLLVPLGIGFAIINALSTRISLSELNIF